ncbi:MAG: transposase [Candidatus Competibacteraceae bacterium]
MREIAGHHPQPEGSSMDRLYYLTDEQEQINRLLPPEEGRRGRPPTVKNREALKGCYTFCARARRGRDLPNACWPLARPYALARWIARGFRGDPAAAAAQGRRPDHRVSGLHRGAGAPARGGRRARAGAIRPSAAPGRIDHQNPCRVRFEADAVAIRITAGQVGDAPAGEALIDAPSIARQHPQYAAKYKAYDSNAIRAQLDAKGITPVIPPKSNCRDDRVHDQERYKQRNKVERLFNKIKQFRRVATRHEKLKSQLPRLRHPRPHRHHAAINYL